MRLRGKIVTAVFAVVVLYGAIDFAVQRWVIFPQFLALERDEAAKDIDRCRQAIQQELEQLTVLCRDWSSWDETYQFMDDRNEQFQKSTLLPVAFPSANLNLVYYYLPSGERIWGKSYALDPLRAEPLADFDARMQANDRAFITHASLSEEHRGLIMTRLGPMMLVSRPVITTELKGPSRGALVMGRLLSNELIQRLSRQIHLPLTPTILGEGVLSPLGQQALARYESTDKPAIFEIDEQTLAVFLHIQDINGSPFLQLRADISRDISIRGRQAVEFASWSLIAGGSLLLCLLLYVIQRIVISPIGSLTRHAVTIGANGNLSLRAEQTSNDEVGLLALEFNRMVDRLAESKRRLMGLSRQAGMSEVASGMLHNVGNVLAGVNCLVDSLKNAIHNSRMHKLSQLSELLQSHASDLPRFIAEDPRGQQVLPYIGQLATRWQEECGHLEANVDALAVNVRHIQSIVESQQRFATRTQVTESTQLQGVIAEISTLCEQSLERHGVTLCTELDEVLPMVSLDRTRLLEVLVNLVTNAKESLIDACSPSPTIRISVHHFADEWVRIEVADNGLGIAPENLTQIFQQAFTTKAKGLGFGLHFSAIAVKDMGGTLAVCSEGLGKGAKFTIDLPCDAHAGGPPGFGRDDSVGTPPALTAELCHTG